MNRKTCNPYAAPRNFRGCLPFPDVSLRKTSTTDVNVADRDAIVKKILEGPLCPIPKLAELIAVYADTMDKVQDYFILHRDPTDLKKLHNEEKTNKKESKRVVDAPPLFELRRGHPRPDSHVHTITSLSAIFVSAGRGELWSRFVLYDLHRQRSVRVEAIVDIEDGGEIIIAFSWNARSWEDGADAFMFRIERVSITDIRCLPRTRMYADHYPSGKTVSVRGIFRVQVEVSATKLDVKFVDSQGGKQQTDFDIANIPYAGRIGLCSWCNKRVSIYDLDVTSLQPLVAQFRNNQAEPLYRDLPALDDLYSRY